MAPLQNPGMLSCPDNQQFKLADNMANINKIKRMWRAQWPEFSWVTVTGDPGSRCYQMFAPDISRVGYGDPDPSNDNKCPVYSIMCPQQGHWLPLIEGTLNVEVTVTGSGGWVVEDPLTMCAQITIKPKIWFSPDSLQNNVLIRCLWKLFTDSSIPFPFSKATAIELNAYGVDQKDQPVKSNILNIKTGLDANYPVPSFATHNSPDEYGNTSATQSYVAVEIGEIISTNSEIADCFNTLVMEVFNAATGNLLQYQNVLSWNVWMLAPEEVFTEEWQNHADYWRFSLDVNHRSPEGDGRDPQYYDGKPFKPVLAEVCNALTKLKNYLINSPLGSLPAFKEIEDMLSSIVAKNCNG